MENLRLEIDCDDATQSELRPVLDPLLSPATPARYVGRRNLDGNTATWVVIATLAGQALPQVLNFLSQRLKPRAVTRIKIGDVEVENPTEKDMEIFRQTLSKRQSDQK